MKKNETIVNAEPDHLGIFLARQFEAPPSLVFKLYTTPEFIEQWMGDQCDLTMRVEKFNPNPGGLYRYVYSDRMGKEFAFHGVFHECLSPKLIVRTFEFEGLPEKGHVSLEKLMFTALPGDRTNVVAHSVFCSVADRDAMLRSGVIKGITDSHERLSSLIEKTTAK